MYIAYMCKHIQKIIYTHMCIYYISMYIFCIYSAHRQNMNIFIYACVYSYSYICIHFAHICKKILKDTDML